MSDVLKKAIKGFIEISKQMEKQNTRASHISFTDGTKVREKYGESYYNQVDPQKVILHRKYEIGCIMNHTPYSPDMDRSGSARVFKINPEFGESGGSVALYVEDLLDIAQQISSVSCIPENSGD